VSVQLLQHVALYLDCHRTTPPAPPQDVFRAHKGLKLRVEGEPEMSDAKVRARRARHVRRVDALWTGSGSAPPARAGGGSPRGGAHAPAPPPAARACTLRADTTPAPAHVQVTKERNDKFAGAQVAYNPEAHVPGWHVGSKYGPFSEEWLGGRDLLWVNTWPRKDMIETQNMFFMRDSEGLHFADTFAAQLVHMWVPLLTALGIPVEKSPVAMVETMQVVDRNTAATKTDAKGQDVPPAGEFGPPPKRNWWGTGMGDWGTAPPVVSRRQPGQISELCSSPSGYRSPKAIHTVAAAAAQAGPDALRRMQEGPLKEIPQKRWTWEEAMVALVETPLVNQRGSAGVAAEAEGAESADPVLDPVPTVGVIALCGSSALPCVDKVHELARLLPSDTARAAFAGVYYTLRSEMVHGTLYYTLVLYDENEGTVVKWALARLCHPSAILYDHLGE